jgi:predicted transposase YdaD
MGANTKFKDSVFSFLFSEPDKLRELYCALEGVTLPHDVPVKINTLQDVLFMDMLNDISFEIGGKLVILIEHQSTINPNMALRLLMYIARVYEKIIDRKSIYGTHLQPLPRPEFFVLYNGAAEYPDENIIRLSQAYESAASLGLPDKASLSLELEVKVININHGRNEEIAKRCKTLAGYSAFVSKVYEYEGEGFSREEAIKNAVHYCVERDILKEFLEQHSSEVMNMLILDWNMEDALAVRYEEGMEKGMEKGMERGRERGREEGREEGMEKGRTEIARNALSQGFPPETIHTITGLDMETIHKLIKA